MFPTSLSTIPFHLLPLLYNRFSVFPSHFTGQTNGLTEYGGMALWLIQLSVLPGNCMMRT